MGETMGKMQTARFVVQIKFQRHSSWQGTITWLNTKKTQEFRSEVELIHLMDEAIQTCQLQTSPEPED